MAYLSQLPGGLALVGRRARGEQQAVNTFVPVACTVRLASIAFAAFAVVLIDALLHPPGGLDLQAMQAVQRIDLPELGSGLEIFQHLTDSSGAVGAWLLTLGVFASLRWWLPLLGVSAIPLGGLVNETVSRVLVQRTRPHLDELQRVSDNFEERSFPSGHVVGAVLLYGFIWYVVGRRICFGPLRWLIRLAAGTVIALAGFDRVWSGAHWPTDVVGGYALGFGLLAILILAIEWIEHEAGLLRLPLLASAIVFRTTGELAERPRPRVRQHDGEDSTSPHGPSEEGLGSVAVGQPQAFRHRGATSEQLQGDLPRPVGEPG